MPVIININALELLVAMGFHRNRSTRALLAVGGSSIDQALEWLGNHMDDPDIDEPTVECLNPKRKAFRVTSTPCG